MTPAELKTALQRTFDIRLSPPQLGAVAHLFGTGGDTAEVDVCDGGKYDSARTRPATPGGVGRVLYV